MRAIAIAALISALCVVVYGQPTSFHDERRALVEKEAQAFQAQLDRGGNGGGPRDARAANTDVLHYLLDIELDPTSVWIGGSNTMRVRSVVENLTAFRFRLDDVFTISDVRVGGNIVQWQRLGGRGNGWYRRRR